MSAAPHSPDEPPALPYATRPRDRAPMSLFTSSLIVAAVLVVLVYTLWPVPFKHTFFAAQAQCASNLRAVWQPAQAYASDNGGVLPACLETLTGSGSCPPSDLVSPLSGHDAPACDYYYVGGLAENDPASWILACGDPAYRKGDGANILYLDGHVQYVKEPKFSQELQHFKAAYEKARGTPPTIIPPH
jgi:prepilin-type processing-associated H-X9-DG protein